MPARGADPTDLALLGLRPATVPELPPGRAVRPDGLALQVALPAPLDEEVRAVADAWAPVTRRPAPVPTLPGAVRPAAVTNAVRLSGRTWRLPVGLDALTLEPVSWRLHVGDHALVLGPAGSGRSGLLRGLAQLAAPHVRVVAVGDRSGGWSPGVEVRSPGAPGAPGALGAVLREVEQDQAPTLVLVDDAGSLPDPGPVLDRPATTRSRVHLVAAARPVDLERDYGHWLRRVASSRASQRPG